MLCICCNNSVFEPFSCSKLRRSCGHDCDICSDKDFVSKYPFKLKICFGRRLEWNMARQYCMNMSFRDDFIRRFMSHAYQEIFFIFEKDM